MSREISDRHAPLPIAEFLIGTGGCWRWPGRIYKDRAWLGNRLAYRVVYEKLIGTPPSGVAHHVCEHGWCVNPWHLEFLSRPAHARTHGLGGGSHQRAKVECPQGHKYDEANTYWTKQGHRKCRQCKRDRDKANRHHYS